MTRGPARDQVYRAHPVRRAVARGLGQLLRAAAALAVACLLAPVTLVAAASAAFGWWRGWPPGRLYAAAAASLPMAAAWLAAVALWPRGGRGGMGGAQPPMRGVQGGRPTAVTAPPGVGPGPAWVRLAAAPYRAWLAMWHLAEGGHLLAAAVAVAPPAIPLGIAAGGLAWAYRTFRMTTGAGGLTPAAPAAFDERQWRHQVRTAKAMLAAPGALPLLSPNGDVVTGATIRSVRHRAGRAAAIPYSRLRSHQVVIGSTGTGNPIHQLYWTSRYVYAG